MTTGNNNYITAAGKNNLSNIHKNQAFWQTTTDINTVQCSFSFLFIFVIEVMTIFRSAFRVQTN